MTEQATDDAFTFKRRFTHIDIAGVGKLRIRNLTAGEFSRHLALQQAVAFASNRGDAEATARLSVEASAALVVVAAVDDEGECRFKGREDWVKEWDAAVLNYVEQEITQFCEYSGNLEEAAKN